MARRFAGLLLALTLVGAAPAPLVGVDMPSGGDDAGQGLAVVTAIRLVLGDRITLRKVARGAFLNPHQDEGSDNDVDVREAPATIASFAADANVVAAVGGLRRNVGDADAAAADARGLPIVVLSRWSRSVPRANAYCLCVSPPRLTAFARGAARERFGPRMLVVLVGAASVLADTWAPRFDGVAISRIGDEPADIEQARRRALDADAVLVIADERPATLWRSAAFRRAFDRAYLHELGHRDFRIVPAGTARGEVLVLRDLLAGGARRRAFSKAFHAAAGFAPADDAIRGYAAAEILRAAGTTRAAVRGALSRRRFDTVAGPVAFDGDGYWRGALAATEP